MENKETLEQEARRLRDIVYKGHLPNTTDWRWVMVEKNWIRDIDWLRDKVKNDILNNNGTIRMERVEIIGNKVDNSKVLEIS